MDADTERIRLLIVIDAALEQSMREFSRATVTLRRAAVLSCAGVPIAIAGQYEMPLVSAKDYEHVAGIEHGDPPRWAHKQAGFDMMTVANR